MIYDCSLFFNELELLELRLSLLYDIVDCFIIVEMNHDHHGNEREFILEKHKAEFSRWWDKVIYVQEENLPYMYEGNKKCFDWRIENFHRQCIFKGLTKVNPALDDIVLISDADEIINPYILTHIDDVPVKITGQLNKKNQLRGLAYIFSLYPKRLHKIMLKKELILNDVLSIMPVSCNQTMYYYFLNNRSSVKWHGTVLCKMNHFSMPQQLRNLRNVYPSIDNAGWHFSYFGGLERIKKKINATVEGEAHRVSDQYIEECLKTGKMLWEGKNEFIPLEKIGIQLDFLNKYIQKYPYLVH